MIQQRRNSRRFVLSELRTSGAGGGGGGGCDADADDDSSSVTAAVDSDDADDGFCIQLEPMAPFTRATDSKPSPTPRSKRTSLADLSSLHDDRPPSKHEIAQWKSIKSLKSGIT